MIGSFGPRNWEPIFDMFWTIRFAEDWWGIGASISSLEQLGSIWRLYWKIWQPNNERGLKPATTLGASESCSKPRLDDE